MGEEEVMFFEEIANRCISHFAIKFKIKYHEIGAFLLHEHWLLHLTEIIPMIVSLCNLPDAVLRIALAVRVAAEPFPREPTHRGCPGQAIFQAGDSGGHQEDG